MDAWRRSDDIALAAVVLSLASVVVTVLVYRAQTRVSHAAEALALHQRWWSAELDQARTTVWPLIEEWEAGERRPTAAILSYLSHTAGGQAAHVEERRAIGRVAFFFADLNAMLDEGLVPERFAYRLFGRAQFAWYADFLLAIADLRDSEASSTQSAREVRWVPEIRALNGRFHKMHDWSLSQHALSASGPS